MQTLITQEANRKTLIEYSSGSAVQKIVNNTNTSIVQNLTGKTFLSCVTQLTVGQTIIGSPNDSVDIELTAGQDVLAYTVITTNLSGQAVPASADNLNHINRIIGVSQTSATTGQTTSVRKTGVLTNQGWNFTPNQLLYLGLNGDIVTNPNLGAFSTYIGYALTANKILINIGRSIVRG